MNERIKELLGQAYDQAVPETWTTLSSEQLGRIYDKFAELIIKECADIADTAEPYKSSDLIKKRFGIEDRNRYSIANAKAGGDIHAGDGGYQIGTQEEHDAFVAKRNAANPELARAIGQRDV